MWRSERQGVGGFVVRDFLRVVSGWLERVERGSAITLAAILKSGILCFLLSSGRILGCASQGHVNGCAGTGGLEQMLPSGGMFIICSPWMPFPV